VDLDERDLERARASLDDAHMKVSAMVQGQALGFQILDPPQMPTEPRRSIRKLMVLPAAAMLAGFGLSIILLILLAAIDRSVRFAPDLSAYVPVIAEVPRLTFDRRQLATDVDVARHSVALVVTNGLPLSVRNEEHGLST